MRVTYAILNPEGYRVHSCKSKGEAHRIAAKFTREDGVPHTVRPQEVRRDGRIYQ